MLLRRSTTPEENLSIPHGSLLLLRSSALYTSSQITRPSLPAVMSRQITKALTPCETDQARLPRPLAFEKMYTFVQ